MTATELRVSYTPSTTRIMQEYRDITYVQPSASSDRYNQFDLYVPSRIRSTSLNPLICFVHGGGWTSQDKDEFGDFARRLAHSSSSPYSVAVVNYRLSKQTPDNTVVHPAHSEDILHFLEFAKDWEGPGGTPVYDQTQIYILGHSCASHMLTTIFMRPPGESLGLESLIPSPRLLQSVRGIVLSGGAYDFDLILRTRPHYRDIIIRPAFGDLPSYEAFNTMKYQLHEDGENIRWLVIHSQGDEIVDAVQNRGLYERLKSLVTAATNGKGVPAEDRVQGHWDLTLSHNGIYTDEEFPRIVHSFISQEK